MSRSPKVTAIAALATLLAAATLSTLVDGVLWFVEVLLAVALVAAVGAVARRALRHPALVVVAQLAAVGLLLSWLYAFPEAIYAVLPGSGSIERLVDLAADGARVTREFGPPAPAVPGLRLLVTGGLALVAIAVDLVAVGMRQPAVAGVPLLAVYCVPTALATGGLDWYWFILAGAGFLLLVASDSAQRVSRWGRVLSGEGGQTAPMAATGRRVGALALGAAVLVPTLVPGLSEGLFPGSGEGFGNGRGEGTISVVNPILDLRDNLTARDDDVVLSYTTDVADPEPLRLVTVDTFDGDTWKPSTGEIPRSQTAADGLPVPPGLDPEADELPLRTTITIETLRMSYLPTPYPPTVIDVDEQWLYEADTFNIVGDGISTEQGLVYTVRHLDVDPSSEQLASAPLPPDDVVERWTALPEDLPAVIGETARAVAGSGDAFSQATALQTFFRNGDFDYTLEAPEENGSTAIADFLVRQNGYCVHFASAMAVMARTLGIPARVAVGFLPGAEQPDGSYEVSLQDAHAWPELYFSGSGWMRFEPTPSTRSGTLPGWAAPLPDSVSPTAPAPVPAPTEGQLPEGGASTNEPSGSEGLDLAAVLGAVPWRVVAALAVVLAVMASPALAALGVRRRRWRRASGPVAHAEAAWLNLTERLADLGRPWPASVTPRQAEARTAEMLDDEGKAALHRLARAVERARYALTPGSSDELRRDVARVLRDVEHGVPTKQRIAATLLPRSGAEHLRSGMVDAGLALDRAERVAAARVRETVRRLSARRGDAASAAPGAP
ncbi:MAG TPA: DUF3488 and transglutaminase-like domain-containing protein [Actinomycetales bacterium]|nr:DUF3488 and transglutaminase-like domain-containing protein [Actinomycetales bacterium]